MKKTPPRDLAELVTTTRAALERSLGKPAEVDAFDAYAAACAAAAVHTPPPLAEWPATTQPKTTRANRGRGDRKATP